MAQYRQDDALTTRQSFYPLIGFLIVALVTAVFMPDETGAWTSDWFDYWKWPFGFGILVGGVIKGLSYMQPKNPNK